MRTVALLCTVLIFTAGCASNGQRVSSRRMELDNMHREIRFLKQQNSQLQRELDNLKKQLEEINQTNLKVKADLSAQIDDVTNQLSAIQNNLTDTNSRITSFNRRPVKPKAATPGVQLNTTAADSLKKKTDAQTSAIDQTRALYNTAYRDLSRGNYQLALQGFQQFVTDYPNSDLTDNAQYWIGEVFYAQGRYQNAIDEFEKVVKYYHNGDKIASALLKIGYSYLKMDETEQGKIYLEELLKDYPKSNEANQARGRLASLK